MFPSRAPDLSRVCSETPESVPADTFMSLLRSDGLETCAGSSGDGVSLKSTNSTAPQPAAVPVTQVGV